MKVDSNDYIRYLRPGLIPFDPLELAKKTEEIICDGQRRKYTKFCSQRFYGGIAMLLSDCVMPALKWNGNNRLVEAQLSSIS